MPNETKEFKELEKFFTIAKLPAEIKLDSGTYIPDVKKLVENNLKALGTGEMNEVAVAGRYYRMKKLQQLLSADSKD